MIVFDLFMNILITGGNGYIGKSIFERFNKKHTITKITKQQINLTNSNQVDRFFDNNKNFDIIIHTAINGGKRNTVDDSSVLDNNLKMYFNLLNNRNSFNKFISFGSGAEIYNPDSFYGLSKKVIHESMQNKDYFYNIRIFALFDQNELETRFIKNNLQRYIDKQPIEIYENKIMDFFFMNDFLNLVDFYIEEKNPPKQVNCSYKEKYSLLDIANIINNLNNYKVEIKINQNAKQNYFGDHNLPINYLGLQKGIELVYNSIKK